MALSVAYTFKEWANSAAKQMEKDKDNKAHLNNVVNPLECLHPIHQRHVENRLEILHLNH
jgi:hypothetical protein